MPMINNNIAEISLIGAIYVYTIVVKNPVKKIMMMKTVIKPPMNDASSILVFDLRLTPTKTGSIGSMQGDSIEITPVVNEINGSISI